MRRREFITVLGGAMAALSFAAHSQQPTPVVGFLSSRSPGESAELVAAFRQGLKETGYLEGQDVHIAFRWAEGRYDRLTELAAELVKTQVAVIASVGGSVAALAAKSVTRTIPIVAVASDPVKHGLVASFNRPGGNITVVSPSNTLLSAKRLELLRELVPAATVIGFLVNPKFPDSAVQLQDAEEAARMLAQQIHILKASSERDIDAAFADLSEQRIGALLAASDPFFERGAIKSCHRLHITVYRRSTPSAHTPSPADSRATRRVLPKPTVLQAYTSGEFSKARNLQTSRSCRRPGSS
jgi:putative tryptophan/tyrosine transport system substrate-binding protein